MNSPLKKKTQTPGIKSTRPKNVKLLLFGLVTCASQSTWVHQSHCKPQMKLVGIHSPKKCKKSISWKVSLLLSETKSKHSSSDCWTLVHEISQLIKHMQLHSTTKSSPSRVTVMCSTNCDKGSNQSWLWPWQTPRLVLSSLFFLLFLIIIHNGEA